MDIIIKSFNRPYYLDRCLFSIEKFVKNLNGKIIVLDDGTPQIYLDKLISKYPKIEIKKSEFYNEKQNFTTNGISPKGYKIPINLWLETAKNASENFILLEDDIWFVDELNCFEVENDIKQNNVVMTKLFWLGNPKLIQNKEAIKKNNIVLLKPKLFTKIPALYYFIFYKFYRFKIRRILSLLKIHTVDRHLANYTIYSTAGMIFNKNYFTELWKNHQNKVEEGLQMFNAIKVLKKQKQKNKFAHYKHEILKTGFMSSATNQYKEGYEGNIDMFHFNKILNQAWFTNKFDSIKSLPKDINKEEIVAILDNDSENKIDSKKWLLWVNSFRNQYLEIGCNID